MAQLLFEKLLRGHDLMIAKEVLLITSATKLEKPILPEQPLATTPILRAIRIRKR